MYSTLKQTVRENGKGELWWASQKYQYCYGSQIRIVA